MESAPIFILEQNVRAHLLSAQVSSQEAAKAIASTDLCQQQADIYQAAVDFLKSSDKFSEKKFDDRGHPISDLARSAKTWLDGVTSNSLKAAKHSLDVENHTAKALQYQDAVDTLKQMPAPNIP